MGGGMGGAGGVGGMGGMGGAGGGMGSAGGVGATSGGTGASHVSHSSQSSASHGAKKADSQPQPSAVVKISEAAVKAMSEPTQEGASFSVSTDSGGHRYVNGMDSNGFSNPDIKQYQQISAMGDSSSASAGGNQYSDLVAATLLALMQKHK